MRSNTHVNDIAIRQDVACMVSISAHAFVCAQLLLARASKACVPIHMSSGRQKHNSCLVAENSCLVRIDECIRTHRFSPSLPWACVSSVCVSDTVSKTVAHRRWFDCASDGVCIGTH